MKEMIRELVKKTKLKYNYFSSEHPNPSLKGKLFKFLNNSKIQFLTTKETRPVTKEELEQEGKKLYFPADMG